VDQLHIGSGKQYNDSIGARLGDGFFASFTLNLAVFFLIYKAKTLRAAAAARYMAW
jgi:hypothetical protein